MTIKLGIIGHGFVGSAVSNGFKKDVQKLIVDPLLTDVTIETCVNDFCADALFVCVPTPETKSGDVDVSIANNVLSELRNLDYKGVVIIKSTITPNHLTKFKKRQEVIEDCVARQDCPLIYLNQSAAHTGILFDGDSGVYNKQASALSEDKALFEIASTMLKDGGIKTRIIKQYIPVINKLVNKYLQILDFYVHFDLDESFTETIRSRHRDQFSYDSFSEGEKQRIDLALLFTWRMIAKMKNSISTNLLLLDETFDSSLDHDGVENLMKILHSLDENSNTFIISHKGDILDGKFKDKIEFVKEKNFSKIAA